MASRRIKLIATAATLVIGAGGYLLYSAFAVQGTGTLAQAPLNVQTNVPPAFIMAVDDSGSMTFETLLPGRDGQAYWDNATKGSNGFFSTDGLRLTGDAVNPANDRSDTGNDVGNGSYNHLFPYVGHRIDASRFAIPPIDNFGFARSPEFNPAYFNPLVTYLPWKRPNATTNVIEDYPQASVTATRPDPDSAASTFKLDAIHLDRIDDGDTVPAGAEMFVLPRGAVLPMGTQYYLPRACGTTFPTFGQWLTAASAIEAANDCQMAIAYRPATFYLKTTTPSPPGYTGNRQTAVNACGNGCNMYRYEITSAMFGTAAPAMLQNFANWFSFYGDRNRSMIAGLTRSLVGVQDMRIGMFTINAGVRNGCGGRNQPDCPEGQGAYYDSYPDVVMRDMNIDAEKATLYRDHLLALPASGSTPNRWAVDHLGKQFQRAPAAADQVDEEGDDGNLPIKLACQKNAGMLFTDGYSNQNGPNVTNVDTGMGAPLSDSHANTMADISAKYYLANMRPDLPTGFVRPAKACENTPNDPKLDCRKNLHMNFYGVTLGAKGALYGSSPYIDDPTTVTNEATTAAFASAPAWQSWQNDQSSTVDEIWHASMNARGEYINATTPADITAAMRRVIASINEGRSPSGSIALTGARIGAGSLTVSPFYEAKNEGTDWYSTLTAQTVSTNAITGVVTLTNAWEASARLPVPGDRNVWFANSAGTPQPFNAANLASLDNLCNNVHGLSFCTAAAIKALGKTPITLDQAVSYLKGDQSQETGGVLRARSTRLGDIVNSTPVISSPKDDYGYRSLPAPYGASYGTYLTTTKDGRRPMVYAGANDGMLHAFDGRETTVGGIERFAYIPNSVLGHMGNLLFPLTATGSDQKFQHRFFVDGPLTVSDAYYSTGWETVLVGTTGAGARGAFALNVSRASRPSSDSPMAGGPFIASDRLWEINDLNTALSPTVRENIGHVLGKAVIAPVKTGTASGPVKWRAIFGNGYNSVSRKAVLFLVDIGPNPEITMVEAVETGAPAGDNGLGNLVVVDRWAPAADNQLTQRSRDGFADTVYAADQKGAIWKFDLRNATPATPVRPLFTTLRYTTGAETGKRQPILGGLTAAAGPGGGVLVYFGTGSFSFTGDPTDSTRQSLYAVLDNNGAATLTRTNLLQQSIVTDGTESSTITNNPMAAGLSGWYLDLRTSERFVAYPRIESGVIFMPTYKPNAAAGCGSPGNNWLYGLNALTGGAALSQVRVGSPKGPGYGQGTGTVLLATGGTAPVKDVAVMTAPRIKPLASDATAADLASALGAQCSMVVQVAGAPLMYLPRACGRQSWRQIQ